MKIAAWITIAVFVGGLIAVIYAIFSGGPDEPVEWGILLKFGVFGGIALIWAVRVLKRERHKESEAKHGNI